MNVFGNDWAKLCQEYRLRRGLKQEAMAQDFNVDQSTVSRWERGEREPGMAVKLAILDALSSKRPERADQALQILLEHSGSAVALWGADGTLLGLSRRLAREFAGFTGVQDPIGRTPAELFEDKGLMESVLQLFREIGFFEGIVSYAQIAHKPLANPNRVAVGGLTSASIFPVRLTHGLVGMMCIYDHDALAEAPDDEDAFSAFWIDAASGRTGHALRRIETAGQPAPA
ncbi:helix-turn-helix domain-containing protein [Roseibium aggregatum]|uniref:Helix-turn-helix transcriptional regulator n=1 Tax=Roseibium aggregatum TaxID=187304 RepID=A0A939EFW6_9HYPH|nr:helix-turn-helix transcriptional regulator [Roseibium aggregatum]MBN9671438.1 helix-turn-helix transcriptional regulator [Roseibium aggregatum]